MHTVDTMEKTPQAAELISPYERFRLGGDEFAICGQVFLADEPETKTGVPGLVIIDVGFRKSPDGTYGPYDIDGSGVQRKFTKPYVLVNLGEAADGSDTKFVNFDQDEPVEIGRSSSTAEQLGLAGNLTVSKKHATVKITEGGQVEVQDQASLNGIAVRSGEQLLGKPTTEYSHTRSISDTVHNYFHPKPGVAPHEVTEQLVSSLGRPLIARDTPINKGVYLVQGGTVEVIVIDDEKYPKQLNDVYHETTELVSTISEQGLITSAVANRYGNSDDPMIRRALDGTLVTVMRTLKYDIEKTNAIAPDKPQKITLNQYIDQGVGVCRTQALLSTYVIERMIREGKLGGRVSVDRNEDHQVEGGHAWTRYTSEEGVVYIVDPAQNYVGTLEQSLKEANTWDYRRTEDCMRQLKVAA